MKILHIIEAYGGGALTLVNQLCNAFCAEHEVVLAHGLRAETPAHFAELLDPRIRCIKLTLTRELSWRQDFVGLQVLCQLLRDEAPDVIHLHSSKAGFLGRLAARLLGMAHRVIYCPHGYAFLRNDVSPTRRKAYWLLEYLASRLAGTVVGCAENEYAEARRLTAKSGWVANAIDLGMLDASTRDVTPGEANRFTVVTAGRLSPAKRPTLFAEVTRRVLAKAPVPVDFLWIGGGDEPLPAPAQATGWLPREDALRMVKRRGTVFLTTSAYEGLPLAVLEAQALGLPVVASDIPGNREALLSGQTGFLGNSADALAGHILHLMKNPEKLAAMRLAARKFIEDRHSLPVLVAAYRPWYAKAAAGHC